MPVTAGYAYGPLAIVAVLVAGCAGGDGKQRTDPTAAGSRAGPGKARTVVQRGCSVTVPNRRIPPGQGNNPGANSASSTYHGNGRLWTVLPYTPNGRGDAGWLRGSRGSIVTKFPWWRGAGVRGRIRIAQKRLDGPAPRVAPRVLTGYGLTGFQASGVSFPIAGCWKVTATVANTSLTFTTLVVEP
jgi:hypothetical protein